MMTFPSEASDLDSLAVLDRSGHLLLTWDPADPAEIAKARAEIERLKAAGYRFFRVVDDPDPAEIGHGELVVEPIADPVRPVATMLVRQDEIEAVLPTTELPPVPAPVADPEPPKRGGKGRGRRHVGVAPMAGG